MATHQLIATHTVAAGGAGTIDFTSIPSTYTDLKLVLFARSNVSAISDDLRMSFNGVTTNQSSRIFYGSGSAISQAFDASGMYLAVNGNTSTSNTFGITTVYIPKYASASYKTILTHSSWGQNATAGYNIMGVALWSSTSAITRFTLTPTYGSAIQEFSTASLYGISNS
jgi:hypothetical protein